MVVLLDVDCDVLWCVYCDCSVCCVVVYVISWYCIVCCCIILHYTVLYGAVGVVMHDM